MEHRGSKQDAGYSFPLETLRDNVFQASLLVPVLPAIFGTPWLAAVSPHILFPPSHGVLSVCLFSLLTWTPVTGLGPTLIQFWPHLNQLYLQGCYFQIWSHSEVLSRHELWGDTTQPSILSFFFFNPVYFQILHKQHPKCLFHRSRQIFTPPFLVKKEKTVGFFTKESKKFALRKKSSEMWQVDIP